MKACTQKKALLFEFEFFKSVKISSHRYTEWFFRRGF